MRSSPGAGAAPSTHSAGGVATSGPAVGGVGRVPGPSMIVSLIGAAVGVGKE